MSLSLDTFQFDLSAEHISEIKESQMYFSATLGKGNFGIVHKAILNKDTEVAVKSSVPGPHKGISEVCAIFFIEPAQIL